MKPYQSSERAVFSFARAGARWTQAGCRLARRTVLPGLLAGGLAASAAGAQTPTIGVSVPSEDQGRFTDLLVPVIRDAAARAGYEIVLISARDNVTKQTADVAGLVDRGVDGIVVGLVNSDAGPVVGAAAEAAGTPLVYMNVAPINVMDLPDQQAYVGPDEADTGWAQALAACAALEGRGRVGLLIGDLLHPAAAARTRAVQEAMQSEACNGVELAYEETAQWNREFAAEVTADWLADGAGLDAVIANNDPMGLGAIDALVAADIDPASIFVTSVNGQPDAIAAVRAGSLDVTYLQDVTDQGEEIFSNLSRMMQGGLYFPVVLMPLTPVTSATVEQPRDRS